MDLAFTRQPITKQTSRVTDRCLDHTRKEEAYKHQMGQLKGELHLSFGID